MNKLDGLSDESYRLAALHELAALDSDSAPELVPLCQCAARLCDAPIAWIALVDASRHWLKASWGWVGSQHRRRETALCDRVVISGQPLTLATLSATEQLLACGDSASSAQAYTGYPLLVPGGQVVGVLAVINQRPSSYSDAQCSGLRHLAALAVEVLLDTGKHSIDQALMSQPVAESASVFLQGKPPRVFHASIGARKEFEAAGYALDQPGQEPVFAAAPVTDQSTWHQHLPNLQAVQVSAVPDCEDPIIVVRADVKSTQGEPLSEVDMEDEDRAAGFLRYANQVLLSEGYGNFSVRKVAKAANVGVGHLQHYFSTKQALLSAMIDALAVTLWQHYAAHIAPVKNPLDRLLACASFVLDDGKRYDRARLLREYTVMSQHEPKVAVALAAYFSRSRATVTQLLQELHPELADGLAEARAAEIVSLLSSAFLFTQSMDASGRVVGYDAYLKARMIELAHFPAFMAER